MQAGAPGRAAGTGMQPGGRGRPGRGARRACLVNTVRPSRNGGLVSCTIRMTRTSSSLVKSVSTCAPA